MRKIRKKIVFVLLFALMLNLVNVAYANGPLPKDERMAIVGDSYAQFFTFSYPDVFDLYSFLYSGIDKGSNRDTLMNLVENNEYKYIVFSTGANDHDKQTNVATFESIIDEFAKAEVLKNRYLILHTYMQYPASNYHPGLIKIREYDEALRRVADRYQNVVYIDMSDYNYDRYAISDMIHYNEEFYTALYDRISLFVTATEEAEKNAKKVRHGVNIVPGTMLTS